LGGEKCPRGFFLFCGKRRRRRGISSPYGVQGKLFFSVTRGEGRENLMFLKKSLGKKRGACHIGEKGEIFRQSERRSVGKEVPHPQSKKKVFWEKETVERRGRLFLFGRTEEPSRLCLQGAKPGVFSPFSLRKRKRTLLLL